MFVAKRKKKKKSSCCVYETVWAADRSQACHSTLGGSESSGDDWETDGARLSLSRALGTFCAQRYVAGGFAIFFFFVFFCNISLSHATNEQQTNESRSAWLRNSGPRDKCSPQFNYIWPSRQCKISAIAGSLPVSYVALILQTPECSPSLFWHVIQARMLIDINQLFHRPLANMQAWATCAGQRNVLVSRVRLLKTNWNCSQ